CARWGRIGDDDRLHAVLFVEFVRALEVLLLEEKRIGPRVERLSGLAPDEIVELVAENGAQGDQRKQPGQAQMARGSQDPGGHQQGIAREKEAEEEPGLREDDPADDGEPARADQSFDVAQRLESVSQALE